MKDDDTGQRLVDIIFICMYIIIGAVWFAFYMFQGKAVWFNSFYDYWTLIIFQLVSATMIIGYIRLTRSLLVMGFLSGCGVLALPVLIEGCRGAAHELILVESLTYTRVIVLLIHITIYIIVALELFYTYKDKKKERLI